MQTHGFYKQLVAQLVGEVRAVAPEGKLIDDLPCLLLLLILGEELALFLSGLAGQVGTGGVGSDGEQIQGALNGMDRTDLQLDGKGFFGLAAEQADLIEAGQLLALLQFLFLVFISLGDEQQILIIQPEQVSLLALECHLGKADLRAINPDMGVITVIGVGFGDNKSGSLSVGRPAQLGKKAVFTKVIQHDFFF